MVRSQYSRGRAQVSPGHTDTGTGWRRPLIMQDPGQLICAVRTGCSIRNRQHDLQVGRVRGLSSAFARVVR